MAYAYSDGGTFSASLSPGSNTVSLLTLPPGLATGGGNVLTVLVSAFDHGFVDQGASPSITANIDFVDAASAVWAVNVTSFAAGAFPIVIGGTSIHYVAGALIDAGFDEITAIPVGTLNGGGTVRLKINSVSTGCTLRGSYAAVLITGSAKFSSPLGTSVFVPQGSASGSFTASTPANKTGQGWFAKFAAQSYDGDAHVAGSVLTPNFEGSDLWQNLQTRTNGGTWVGFGYLPGVIDGELHTYSFQTDPVSTAFSVGGIREYVCDKATGRSWAQMIG